MAVLVQGTVPGQLTFQVDRALGDARRLHHARRLDGQTGIDDLVVVRAVAVDGLEALRVVLNRGILQIAFGR